MRIAALIAGLLLAAGPAAAQEPKTVAAFKDWMVFVREINGDTICYAATEARQMSPQTVTHGGVFFMVASWKSGAAREQPSLMVGYNLKDSPAPTLQIDSRKWEMYVSENEAFIESAEAETSLIAAMKRGANMRVSATSARGTATSYVMSLSGVTAALDRAAAACK